MSCAPIGFVWGICFVFVAKHKTLREDTFCTSANWAVDHGSLTRVKLNVHAHKLWHGNKFWNKNRLRFLLETSLPYSVIFKFILVSSLLILVLFLYPYCSGLGLRKQSNSSGHSKTENMWTWPDCRPILTWPHIHPVTPRQPWSTKNIATEPWHLPCLI